MRRLTVRSRVLLTVLALVATGLVVAGAVSHIVAVGAVRDDAQASLEQEVAEFRALATKGVDPQTGEPFAGVEQLLRVAMERNVPAADETIVTFYDARPQQFSGGGDLDVAGAEELREAVESPSPDSTRVVYRDLEIDGRQYRMAAVPVRIGDGPRAGSYVVVYDSSAGLTRQNRLTQTYAAVALISLALIGIAAWFIVGRLLRPLQDLREAALRTSEEDLTQRVPVRGGDDVSQLAQAFNTMVGRLEEAFAEQRRLIDDAGHELRTPITIVRGHLELLDPSDPDEVTETRDLLLDEADRMGRLVEDLILLAKAEGERFVDPRSVDLAELTESILTKARGLAERDWRCDGAAPVVVSADPHRITQAVLQLAHNAVKFAPPPGPIAIGSAAEGGIARLWVRDHGPGVEPGDRERIFERFGRAETGRGIEGSGLGLAIVKAIAEAHGGSVTVGQATGGGAIFTITLPLETDPWPTDAPKEGL